MIRGLVIGKFYPPHRGHKFLIETALAQVDHLDVLVCAHPEQTIPGELRARWLQEIHPAAFVRAIDDPGEDDNSEFWAEYTVQILGSAPDVVFTSEEYGESYARFQGCRHVMIDRERVHVGRVADRAGGRRPPCSLRSRGMAGAGRVRHRRWREPRHERLSP